MKQLGKFKNKCAIEEQATRTLHMNIPDLQAKHNIFRVQRDGEEQRLEDDRGEGERVIAACESELPRINNQMQAAKERQRKLAGIVETSERSSGCVDPYNEEEK